MLKNIIQWNYERGTWPYDIFCLLIVAFIFLTPKAWFEKRDIGATRTPQTAVQQEAFLPGKLYSAVLGNDMSGGSISTAGAWKTIDLARERRVYAVDKR